MEDRPSLFRQCLTAGYPLIAGVVRGEVFCDGGRRYRVRVPGFRVFHSSFPGVIVVARAIR